MRFEGSYFDGRSAQGIGVSVAFENGTLVILTSDTGAVLATWRLSRIELAELPPSPDAPVRLRCRDDPGALLSIADEGGKAALTRALPHLLDRRRRRRGRLVFITVGAILSVAIVAGAYFGWPQLARQAVHLVPYEFEVQLGDSTLAQVESIFAKRCTAPDAQPGHLALRKLVRRLGEARGLDKKVNVHVVEWSYKNAFALPGGHVVFTDAMIDFFESPAELAGVLAHEMGHVEKRHAMVSMIEHWGLTFLISVMFGGSGGMGDLGYSIVASAYSRDLEREADGVALEMLAAARIDSSGIADVFERILKQRTGQANGKTDKTKSRGIRLPDFLASHPALSERIGRARTSSGAKGKAMSEADWAAVKAICGNKNDTDEKATD